MKFEIDISDNAIIVSLDEKVLLMTTYMSRACDVIEDVYKHKGKGSSLIPWPLEGEK